MGGVVMAETGNFGVGGERYEATVPDTLDLVERAELALNGLGGCLDPEQNEPTEEWHGRVAVHEDGKKIPPGRHPAA
ncbi:MAG: hypothetical protein CL878_01045 [Dehalococcoidia bacterium]|nr:hypothetical protein [Dehalococcoidia bacterium]